MNQSSHRTFRHDRQRQTGAALFMALIFLLVLTVLGVFGMNLSRLENLMAGNTQFQTEAMNNAEYVLIAAEDDIKTLATDKFSVGRDVAGDHYYPVTTTDFNTVTAGTQQPTDVVWNFSTAKIALPDIGGEGMDTDADGNADDGTGEYVIQDAGYDNTAGECETVECELDPLAGAIVQVFLVSAQSGTSRGARRILQSVVVTNPL
jgi:Tfp pilus assembly protein PilX